MAPEPNRPVKTTAKSLELIEVMKDLEGATVSELVKHTDLAKTTIHNHLQTLLNAEYITRENNTYDVGLRLFHLGEYARKRKNEFILAKKAVHELATDTQMEADFNVEEHGRLINLYDAIGHSSDSGWEVGTYFHMHSTSAGKAILAELPDKRVDEIISKHGLPEKTENTINTRAELDRELEEIRKRGYAGNEGECFSGYKTIGKAVKYPDGSILGSMAVGGPEYMVGQDLDQSAYGDLRRAVDDLESAIAEMYSTK